MSDTIETFSAKQIERISFNDDAQSWVTLDDHNAAVSAIKSEIERLYELVNRQRNEISDLESFADAKQRLDDIARVVGCNHTEDPDGRLKLVHCVEETIAAAVDKGRRLEKTTPKNAGKRL